MKLTRRELVIAAAGLVVAAGVGIGVAETRPTPPPTLKIVAPPCPTPGPFLAGQTYTLTGCQTVPANGFTLPAGVTINGGAFIDTNKLPCPYTRCPPTTNRGRPAFTVTASATNVTLENLTLNGANVGGYNAKLAFNAGIDSVGSSGLTIKNVSVSHVFGDCLNLEPLRGAKGSIVAPTTNLTVTGLTVSACGRQGITPASVNGATFTGVTVGSAGFDSVDIEADQDSGEGAKNVVFNAPCTFQGLVSVDTGGMATGPVTFNGCSMNTGAGGDALLVRNRDKTVPLAPITLSNDTVRCGASAYVACLELGGASVVVTGSNFTIGFKGFALHEAAWHAKVGTTLTISGSTFAGYYKPGTADFLSTVTVTP